jgi:hypothetical protein
LGKPRLISSALLIGVREMPLMKSTGTFDLIAERKVFPRSGSPHA